MKVSIVTPTLALDDFLAEARQSVARQDSGIEIEHLIVVDDRQAVLPADDRHGNVATLFLHNAQEKGPGGARNTALDRATGDFVFFLDADDVWDPDHLRRAVGVYQGNPQVDCISIAGLSFGQSVRHVRMTIPDLPQGIIPRHSVAWNPIGGPTGFSYRRSAKTAAVRFKDALYFADIIFYLELLHLGATFWRENSVRYWYRRSPGQLISIAPIDKIRASEARVHQEIAAWKDSGLSAREARLASVQIRRLSANRQRRPSYRNTLLLAAIAPRWAASQVMRQVKNMRIRRTAPRRPDAAPGFPAAE
ncbi:glycosyltransferase family 2 protein [Novosphingobium sp. RL4]|uniref:glycosyltransferase family 2 protein n=1 Tax=Novosphingobium sp. RL4 TaxID=3109595 RepID=UPI002D772F33|nr:glycosyltransferase family 2 protein [Novosphingobium sp. RL4]WRT95310.1 glycosyltransferase family 2 protein [Novosphingobium sp. RL4]